MGLVGVLPLNIARLLVQLRLWLINFRQTAHHNAFLLFLAGRSRLDGTMHCAARAIARGHYVRHETRRSNRAHHPRVPERAFHRQIKGLHRSMQHIILITFFLLVLWMAWSYL